MRFSLCALLYAFSVPAEAQQGGKVPRVGFLVASSASFYSSRIEAFRQGLRDLGYVEGKNIAIEYRFAEGKEIVFVSSPPSWFVSRLTSSSLP